MSETSSAFGPVKTLQDVSDDDHVNALTAAVELLFRHSHLERSESQDLRNSPELRSLAAESSDELMEQAFKVHYVILALTGTVRETSDGPWAV